MKCKTIALVAHDNRKKDLAEWVQWNDAYIPQTTDYMDYIGRDIDINNTPPTSSPFLDFENLLSFFLVSKFPPKNLNLLHIKKRK